MIEGCSSLLTCLENSDDVITIKTYLNLVLLDRGRNVYRIFRADF